MLQYQRIDVSERIDINKSHKSKECMICHYWHFKDIAYKFEPYVCNKYHGRSAMTFELKNIAILNALIIALVIDAFFGIWPKVMQLIA